MTNDTIQGTCDQRKGEHPDPLKRICNKPAMLRYPAMNGGYMLLCEEHGRPHVRYCERWDGETWQRSAIASTDSEVLAKLQDPAAVCVNMIRGTIAKPSLRALLHVYGAKALEIWDAANGDEKMAATDGSAHG